MENEYIPSPRELGKGVKFDRIRRITGYLVGTLDRFNTGKRAEEADRVKHDIEQSDNFSEAIAKEELTA